jgi:ABC-type transport system involved in cytochrome c biogenesis permease subunit
MILVFFLLILSLMLLLPFFCSCKLIKLGLVNINDIFYDRCLFSFVNHLKSMKSTSIICRLRVICKWRTEWSNKYDVVIFSVICVVFIYKINKLTTSIAWKKEMQLSYWNFKVFNLIKANIPKVSIEICWFLSKQLPWW